MFLGCNMVGISIRGLYYTELQGQCKSWQEKKQAILHMTNFAKLHNWGEPHTCQMVSPAIYIM